jgi:N utilization substance protein A
MKGSRVQSIIRELRGEKIDIVQFSEDTSTLVTNSLNPAKINRVQLTDPENKGLEVVVDDEQLSLAIGKKGQNVRLASRLVGWKIDIKSEQEKKREVEAELERMARDSRELAGLEGVSEKILEKTREAGFGNVEAILAAGIEGLGQIQGIGPKTAEKLFAAAQAMFDTRPQREEEERLRQQQEEEEAAAVRAAEQAADDQAAAERAAADQVAQEAAAEEAGTGDRIDAADETEIPEDEGAPVLDSGAQEQLLEHRESDGPASVPEESGCDDRREGE